jgi:hypothetical protein
MFYYGMRVIIIEKLKIIEDVMCKIFKRRKSIKWCYRFIKRSIDVLKRY